MIYQNLFPEKNITSFSSAELAQRVVKVKGCINFTALFS